jgi:hypothetical protein
VSFAKAAGVIPILCLALAGCGSLGQHDVGNKEVAVSCVPPATPDAPAGLATRDELLAMDGPTRLIRIADDYLALLGWSLKAGPVLQGCRAAGTP